MPATLVNFRARQDDTDELDDTLSTQSAPEFAGQFATARRAVDFMLAGKAYVTLRSKKTGARYTYRIKHSQDKRVAFVGVLTGGDNNSMYSYLGHMFLDQRVFWHGKKSKITRDAVSYIAFDWAWRQLSRNRLPDALEIWHEGCCGRCGRKLTVPESIATGFGPTCAEKVGM